MASAALVLDGAVVVTSFAFRLSVNTNVPMNPKLLLQRKWPSRKKKLWLQKSDLMAVAAHCLATLLALKGAAAVNLDGAEAPKNIVVSFAPANVP
jgi:hypothetical protein